MRTMAAVFAALLPLSSLAAAEPPAELVAQARDLARAFFTELKTALEQGIAETGPAGAIAVCGEKAPGIGGSLSERSGWAVGRTALRVRNPRNAPDSRERAVLVSFRERIAAGEDPAQVEQAMVVEEGGVRWLHYMKVIPMGEVCTTCHGTDIDPQVQAAIRARYPADAATGFRVGELRGAFTFVKPLP